MLLKTIHDHLTEMSDSSLVELLIHLDPNQSSHIFRQGKLYTLTLVEDTEPPLEPVVWQTGKPPHHENVVGVWDGVEHPFFYRESDNSYSILNAGSKEASSAPSKWRQATQGEELFRVSKWPTEVPPQPKPDSSRDVLVTYKGEELRAWWSLASEDWNLYDEDATELEGEDIALVTSWKELPK